MYIERVRMWARVDLPASLPFCTPGFSGTRAGLCYKQHFRQHTTHASGCGHTCKAGNSPVLIKPFKKDNAWTPGSSIHAWSKILPDFRHDVLSKQLEHVVETRTHHAPHPHQAVRPQRYEVLCGRPQKWRYEYQHVKLNRVSARLYWRNRASLYNSLQDD